MSTIQDLGFTREEIEQKVVAKIADDLMAEYVYDDETGTDVRDTHLAVRFREIIKKHVERQLNKLAEEYVVPHVKDLIEGVALQKTNEWGEKQGAPRTFVEYLTDQATNYLSEPVDFDGKPVGRGSYSRETQTRLVNLVHKHLHYSIESAMKDAVEVVKKQLGASLEQTCKLKLNEIAENLKVSL